VTTSTLEYEDKIKKAYDFSKTFSIEGKLPRLPVDISSTSVSSSMSAASILFINPEASGKLLHNCLIIVEASDISD